MKQKRRILTLIILALILFSFSNIQFFLKFFPNYHDNNEDEISELNSAKYWPNLNRIHIDDSNTSLNWATTAANNDWCNGSGTWSDPYIIKNVIIDGQERESCILIKNSNVFFIIENCTVYNTGDEGKFSEEPGIKLINTNNGTFISNNCSLNHYGIRLFNSDNNTFLNNMITKNEFKGITLEDSSNNTFAGNEISNNYLDGIVLESNSDHNNISQNKLYNNFGSGLSLMSGDNNTINNNDIFKNREYGIFLEAGRENTIKENAMKKCGIGISPSEEINTNIIDTSNTVNGKTFYIYFNQTDLDNSDFSSPRLAGQIILIKCNDSIISNFNLSQTSIGLILYECQNNTISNNLVNNCTKSGFYLNFCNNNTIYNNSVNYNFDGIELFGCINTRINRNNATNNKWNGIKLSENCVFNIIHGNNASNNIETGIYTEYCESNNITKNLVLNNERAGIRIKASHFTLIQNNTANNNINTRVINFGVGIQIGETGSFEQSNNNTITENIMNNNSYVGLFLDGKNNTITKNNFTNCGLIFGYYSDITTIDDFSSQTIDRSNLVNNKILYYYFNSTHLSNDNFSNAGQVVLVRCNDSLISNLQLERASLPISSYYCDNITISNNNLTENTFSGIYLIQNSNSNISNNQLNTNINIYLEVSTVITFGFGIYLEDCYNCNFTFNNATNNGYGIYLKDSNNILIKNNTFYDNNIAGISILANQPGKCDDINFSANYMRNCGVYIYESPYLQNSKLYIDKTNLINNRPLHYFSNTNSLKSSDFINPGQIILLNCNNSEISNLSFSRCTIGISLFYCHNASVYNINSSKNSMYGFVLVLSNNCHLFNNTASQNLFGIFNVFCFNNTYTGNTLKNSKSIFIDNLYFGGGICSMWYNDNLNIVRNTFENCSNGIMIYLEGPGIFFNVSDNLLDNNIQYGIWLKNCHNSTFTKNKIQNNGIGIYLDFYSDNSNNSFLYNNLNGNDLNAQDNGDNNKWDDGFAGNYWDDYTGIDANIDAIGDNSYTIRGLAYNKDNYPLIYRTDIDTDGDGLINYEEYVLGKDQYRTNVTNPDTDYDELSDYWEWKNSTNPWNPDTDFDRMPDGWEVFNFLNPISGDDNITDADNDFLLNVYEFKNGTDPNNEDTDGDTFLDGIEAGALPEYNWWTDPLNKWWYPMPNLVAVGFQITSAELGKPFVLNITIKNDGIWDVENITIIIWVEYLGQALYNNSENPIPLLEVDEVYQDFIQSDILPSEKIPQGGRLVMELRLDPENVINETYSNKDGSARHRSEDDNILETILNIGGQLPGGGFDIFWIILIVIGVIALAGITSTYMVLRPRMKRRAAFKRQIETAKTDINNFEINMRSFIKTKLIDTYESRWWDEGVPEYIRTPIGTKIKTLKPKKPGVPIDRMDLLDFTHYSAIITQRDNWEHTFSKIFPERGVVDTNFENLRIIKRDLAEGTITRERLSSYSLFLHNITNFFRKGFNVFLSYSTLDTEYFNVKEIAKRLESFPEIDRVFFWEEDSGENIVTYMERTLAMTKAFVFFCTEHSVRSKAVEDEWQAAFQMRKKGLLKIVPVYENENIIPFLLMPLLNVKYTKDDFDGFIQKLYEEILR
ncbi:MAG: NosD domain-containing protein [Promethearchaeota archaeon]